MSLPKILALIVVLTLALLGFQYFKSNEDSTAALAPETPADISVKPESQQVGEAPDPDREVTGAAQVDEQACLTFEQFEQLPEVLQDMARIEQVSVSGTPMSAYENLGEATLHGFAEQGDAAAMAVLGAMHVMRAYQVNESLALEWLNHGQRISDLDLGNSQLSSAASLSLNDAAYWFYEAAMHGRVLALQNYGQVRGRLFGGPVGIGWIDQQAYEMLTENEKSSLLPANLYAQVAYDIVPTLRDGAVGVVARRIPQSSVQQAIRDELVIDFQHAVADRGLAPVAIPPDALPEVEGLLDQLCSSE